MRRSRLAAALLACMLLLSCSFVPAAAAEMPDNRIVMPRTTGQLNHRLSANTLTDISEPISLDAGETVTYNCTYTPKSASIDFGVIAPDGLFYSLNCTNGSFNHSLEISDPGQYTLAIRNNSSRTVTLTGTVQY